MTAKEYAIKCHNDTNHTYNGHPYQVHLVMVVAEAQKFIHLIPWRWRENVINACWCHDVIEDCRQTYNDVMRATNGNVAEIVYALTNEKGKNRAERANDKYYQGIRDTPFASFVKICDRIANYKYSIMTNDAMAVMYEKEMYKFIRCVYNDEYKEMLDYLLTFNPKKYEPTN